MVHLSSHSKLIESIGLYLDFSPNIGQGKWEKEKKGEKDVVEKGRERKGGEERRRKIEVKHFLVPQNIVFISYQFIYK